MDGGRRRAVRSIFRSVIVVDVVIRFQGYPIDGHKDIARMVNTLAHLGQ